MSKPSTTICRSVRAGQTCTDPNCGFSHTPAICETCNLVFVSAAAYEGHLTGQKHRRRALGQSIAYVRCPLCDIHVGPCNWNSHLQGSKHQHAAETQGVSPEVQPEQAQTDIPGHSFCVTCNQHIVSRYWRKHLQSKGHIARLSFAKYQTAIDEAESDKNGVTITGAFNFDIVEPAVATGGVMAKGSIQTTLSSSQIKLVETSLASSKGQQVSPFTVSLVGNQASLTSTRPISFTVKACQDHLGRSNDRLDFTFEDAHLKKRFLISRSLRIIVGSKADHDLLKPKAPYKPRQRVARQPETKVVEGVAPPALKAIPYTSKLPKATIPTNLLNTLSNGTAAEIMRQVREVHLPTTFDSNTYGRYFKSLLWIEEFRMERDLEHYDIDNAKLTQHNSYYYLDVPGLAEKRPSVLIGDSILAQKPEAENGHWYEGRVHFVRKENVGLRFHSSFRGDQTLRVRFKLNRYPMRRQHMGMDSAFTQERVLFPLSLHLPQALSSIPRITFYNPLIGNNPAQRQAVSSILNQVPGSIPFVVFGPPGTGKTVTIVEAILQILHQKPTARILACAPSNSAADLIACRLTALPPTALFRAYAPSRSKEQVPTKLQDYIYQNRDGHFAVPMDRLSNFRVVVTTCVSASMMSGVGIPRGHFSHIFVDEAGQATEPEAMIAIKTMANGQANIVLSGDPKQLGPIIRSSVARQLGLEKSYIERLMERDIYDEKEGHGRCVVKLVKNFRSHEAILKFPNDRFYKGDLESCGDSKVINGYLNSSHVGKYGFPIVFYAVIGKDDREASSPSFFNIDEVTQVKNVIEKLRFDRNIRISDDEIGVITPYHAQCLKIRARLRNFADSVKVGSVEEFQGQERKVIIVSTVRSSQEFVEFDLKHTLGFVASPRRFNVAITRAKALLVVIGNPTVLSLDPLWRSFLNYVHNNGGWKGPAPSWDTNEDVDEAGGYDHRVREAAENDMNEFTRVMESLTLASIEDEGGVDKPWNDTE